MFGHCESRHERHGKWAAGRHRGRHFGRHGMGGGGRHGTDCGDDMMRAGRMLAQGDLRLIALALIAEQPRHGYEIIKLLEEKTADWYSPSPGIVYPTLTYLEEAGYVTAQHRRRQEALRHHRRRPRLSRGQPRLRRCGAGTARRARRARQPLAPLSPRTWRGRPPQVAATARSRHRQPARRRSQTARRRRGRRAARGRNPRPRGDRFAADVSGAALSRRLRRHGRPGRRLDPRTFVAA